MRIDFTAQWWGHAIHDVSASRICAHSTPVPSEGDEILRPMESGKTGIFRLSKFKRFCSPSDMWAADTTFVGYLGETKPSVIQRAKRWLTGAAEDGNGH